MKQKFEIEVEIYNPFRESEFKVEESDIYQWVRSNLRTIIDHNPKMKDSVPIVLVKTLKE